MPLVRISHRSGKPAGYGKRIGEVVYRSMMDAIKVPVKDNFQIISEHDANGLIYDPEYLGIARSDDVVLIQLTISEGRTVEAKQNLFRIIAERLHLELGMRMEDVFINLVETRKENWSFGNGVAQYVAQPVAQAAAQAAA
jgi:phenylpyruvate tautomerase PptA (4-oxalocrotonate tautomerase family)